MWYQRVNSSQTRSLLLSFWREMKLISTILRVKFWQWISVEADSVSSEVLGIRMKIVSNPVNSWNVNYLLETVLKIDILSPKSDAKSKYGKYTWNCKKNRLIFGYVRREIIKKKSPGTDRSKHEFWLIVPIIFRDTMRSWHQKIIFISNFEEGIISLNVTHILIIFNYSQISFQRDSKRARLDQ